MKKGLFISALVALCAFVAVAQSENLLVEPSVTPIEEFESFVSVDVSDLNVKSGFVLSFTLNQDGIDYLNGWGDEAFYDKDGDPVSTPVIVSMGLGDEDEGYFLFGVGWSGNPNQKIANKPRTGSKGTFALLTVDDGLMYSDHSDNNSGDGWCYSSGDGKVIDRSTPANAKAQKDIKAVALTLTGNSSGLLELTASVKYEDDELRVFTPKEGRPVSLESESGNGNPLVVNTGFVDVEAISLSYEFEEGETAEKRNWNLLFSGAPSVPEPATATLSLLALAGLAARRKRH